MINFGAATILFNGSDLGKTYEGGSITPTLQTIEDLDLDGNTLFQETIVGGKGEINFYEWSNSISLSESTALNDWGILEINMDNFHMKFWEARLFINLDGVNFGTYQQKGFKVKFVFRKDNSGKVLDIY